eukprot:CAMPEP_0197718964 /NCGR_PEP_ID=MMETSP1434-20131217/2905_1 /TAXON_ID=265543 /ORGANISM="Minutocellus polymorphus, Strain CCMP3303" /LENGTH=299 /DNA_ID=CAMNT_0043303659 /DNA_START=102 /DNA_END=1001 /DNA_ORIENTATION=-
MAVGAVGRCALIIAIAARMALYSDNSNYPSTSSSSSVASAGGDGISGINHRCSLSRRHHPVCLPGRRFDPTQYDEIYMLHMRKAGGTTMRVFLKRVAETHNLTLRVSEGEPDTTTVDWERTFRVTNLRHPIQRAISHYKYDQRWRCSSASTESLKRRKFVPSERNVKRTFEDFLHVGDRQTPNSRHPHRLWTCATNCLARWATGHAAYVDVAHDTETARTLLEDAYNALCQYDLIVNTEWLANETYRVAIEKFFGVDGLYDATQKASKKLFCAKKSRAANAKVPLVIWNETQKDLEAGN